MAVARKKAAQVEIEKAVKRGGADIDRMAAEILEEDEQPPARGGTLSTTPPWRSWESS